MSDGTNPFILFLILILLVLGMDPDAGKKIENIKNAVDKVTTGVGNLQASIKSLSTDFEDAHTMLLNLNKPGSGSAGKQDKIPRL